MMSFSKYYTPNVEIKDFNGLIDKKTPKKHENIIDMSKNNDCTTGNLLDYDSLSNDYKLIAIGLSKHVE